MATHARMVQACTLAAVLGTGCATQGTTSLPAPTGLKAIVGGLGGATAGGLLASQLSHGNAALTAGGVLLGLLGGAGVGSLLDNQDHIVMQKTLQQAATAPTGTRVPWSNPATGRAGAITPGVWQHSPQGHCRAFTMTVWMEGELREVHACAIQQANGEWVLAR